MSRLEPINPPVQFGKYQLTERIAVGRMGEVFRAKRDGVEGFAKILVVKRLFAHLSANQRFVETFVEEAKLTVSLSHANIVQVLDLGHRDGAYFMATEYVPGYDLSGVQHIQRHTGQAFPPDIAVFIVSEVAKGLDYAHRRKDYNFQSLNIVHRDLSPANVLISFEGEVKISDFGISRALELLQSQDPMRKYMYCPPEQARGEAVTHQSDIFGLGLILYQLVSGQHPYAANEPAEVHRRATDANIAPVASICDVPRALSQIIDSTLQLSPGNRIDSAGTLYEELISYLFASGNKADNRSLSKFMQSLRAHEEDAFAGIPMGSSMMAALPSKPLQQRPSGGTLNRMANVDGRSSQPAMDLGPGIPDRIGELAGGLRAGFGGATILTGELGLGDNHIPDRLADALTTAGVQTATFVASTTDLTTPYALATTLVRKLIPLPDPASFNDDPAAPGVIYQALAQLAGHGAPAAEIQMIQSIWGVAQAPNLGFHEKRSLVLSLCERIVGVVCEKAPLAVVVSSAEHIDPLSADLFSHLAKVAPERPLLLILAPSSGVDLRTARASLRFSDGVETVPCSQSSGVLDPSRVIRQLRGAALPALTAMYIADRPLSVKTLERLAGRDAPAAVRQLKSHRAARSVAGDCYAISDPSLRLALAEHARGPGRDEARRIAKALLEQAVQASGRRETNTFWAGPLHRLLVYLGHHRDAARLADRYRGALQEAGWREIALSFQNAAQRWVARSPVGDPAALTDAAVHTANAALDLMKLGMARNALTTVFNSLSPIGDGRRIAEARVIQGLLALEDDDCAQAFDAFRNALDGATAAHDHGLTMRAHEGLTAWHFRFSDLRSAQYHADAAANLGCQTQRGRATTTYRKAQLLAFQASVLARRGQVTGARRIVAVITDICSTARTPSVHCFRQIGEAHVTAAEGRLVDAIGMAEDAYNMARELNLVSLGLKLAVEVADFSLAAGDLSRTRTFGEHLKELGARYGSRYVVRRGEELAMLSTVLDSGHGADRLTGLNASLAAAQKRTILRDELNAHVLLFQALKHLGNRAEADRHRGQAATLAGRLGAVGLAATLR